MNVKVYEQQEKYIKECVHFLTANASDNSNIALSGGSTPLKIYQALAADSSFPIEEINFFQTDERYVPPEDQESNFKLITESLFKNRKPKSFTHFDTKLPIEECADEYENNIKDISFQITLLGIGTDGHTASLFPSSPALEQTKRLAVHTDTDNFAIKDRLTITFPQILKSKKLLVLLEGPKKHRILSILTNSLPDKKRDISNFPALKLLEHEDLNLFYLI